jgi:hypothetical protein
MPFRYLRDPLFLACCGLYLVNRWVIKPHVAGGFFHEHLNDLICIPVFVPIMVFAMRKLRLRCTDEPPPLHEIAIPLVIWSLLFEVLLPQNENWGRGMTADHLDVVSYALGAFLASLFWTFFYQLPVICRRGSSETGPAPRMWGPNKETNEWHP